jgi:hypothetical protein
MAVTGSIAHIVWDTVLGERRVQDLPVVSTGRSTVGGPIDLFTLAGGSILRMPDPHFQPLYGD